MSYKKIITYIIVGSLSFIPFGAEASHTWTMQQPVGVTQNWEAVASDADGSNLIAAAWPGRLYTSSDGGAAWTERQPAGNVNGNWITVASDSDGSVLIAGNGLDNNVYVSTDGGANWSLSASIVGKPAIVDVDSDGSHMIVGSMNGRFYTSSDGGATWTERQPAGNLDKVWYLAATNADGSVIVAGVYGGRLYTSTDGGATWTERQPAGNVNKNWFSAGMGTSGADIVVGSDGAGGRLYTSSDGGATWTERQPAGNLDKNWYALDMDSDGSSIVAAAYAGRVYLSTDGGATWNEEQPAGDINKNWYRAAIDSDGSHLIVSGDGMNVYTGVDIPPDTTAPSVSYFSPVDGATDVSVNATFEIAFDEDVATSTGNIVLKRSSDDSIIETIDVTSNKVTASSTNAFLINPATTLSSETGYYFEIDSGAFEDLAANAYSGISLSTTWNFTTADVNEPSVIDKTPDDDATDVDSGVNLSLTFDEDISVGTGNITIKKVSDNSVVQTIDISDASVSVSGATLTVDLSSDLTSNREYYVNIDSGALEDLSGNSYSGISDSSTWNFTTESQSSSSGSKRMTRPTTTNPIVVVNNGASSPSPQAPVIFVQKFERDLFRGLRGEDVRRLQIFLNKEGFILAVAGPGSMGSETELFGELTAAALIKYQQSKGIKPAVGYFGPITRALVNSLLK